MPTFTVRYPDVQEDDGFQISRHTAGLIGYALAIAAEAHNQAKEVHPHPADLSALREAIRRANPARFTEDEVNAQKLIKRIPPE